MAYKFEEVADYTGGFKDRSHWERQAESQWAHGAIGNIESFLTGVDWDNLGSSGTEQSVLDKLSTLESWNADRVTNENTLSGRVDLLEGWNADRVANENTATTRINDLQTAINKEDGGILDRLGGLESYFDNPDLNLTGLQGKLEGMFGAAGEGTEALQALWKKGGAGTAALDDLRTSLNTDWESRTFGDKGMSMDEISNTINQQGQTTEGLQAQFTGLFDEGGKGAEAIDAIFNEGAEGRLGTALSDLSSDLVSTYNLEDLDNQSQDIKTNIQNITNLTAADTALGERITNWEGTAAQNQADVATALAGVGGLTTDLATATGDINQLRTDAKSWVENLDMEADYDRLMIRRELENKSNLWNQRLTDLSSSMDYKNLGDSATGVRTRKSKARAAGQTRFGTGQLNRSMKLTSLNI